MNISSDEEDQKKPFQKKQVDESKSDDSDDGEQTISTKDQKARRLREDATLRAKKVKEIKIMRYLGGKQKGKDPYTFKGDFTINRNRKKTDDNSVVEEVYKDISRKHAEVLLLSNGFYMRDEGSTNHIYIKVGKAGAQILLQKGMEFRLGHSLIEILNLELEDEEILLNIRANFALDGDAEKAPPNEHRISVGKNKEMKFPTNQIRKKFFKEDQSISEEQISFVLLGEKFILKCNTEDE